MRRLVMPEKSSNIAQMRFEVESSLGQQQNQGGRSLPMTPHQLRIVGQASREMNPVKVRNLLDELCRAIDSEHEEHGGLRRDGRDDHREYPVPFLCE
jgi:hypothetical protein